MEPLSYYFADRNPAINRLADDYGDRLERMTTGQKLLAISVLSGVLHELETVSHEVSIADYMTAILHTLDDGGNASLCESLKNLDNEQPSTVATLVMVLGIYAAEEVR